MHFRCYPLKPILTEVGGLGVGGGGVGEELKSEKY